MKTAVISMVTAEINYPINTMKTHVIITILQVITSKAQPHYYSISVITLQSYLNLNKQPI